MDGLTQGRCYPWATEGEIESMAGRVFGHSFLVLNRVPDKPNQLRWDPLFCQECWSRALTLATRWGKDGPVLTDYNYINVVRLVGICWNLILKPLWEYVEGEVTEGPTNRIWSFLIEPATRNRRPLDYVEIL